MTQSRRCRYQSTRNFACAPRTKLRNPFWEVSLRLSQIENATVRSVQIPLKSSCPPRYPQCHAQLIATGSLSPFRSGAFELRRISFRACLA